MPLSSFEDRGQYYVRGVTAGDAVTYLGTRAFKVGDHYIGFDDSFADPLVMRSFYDPSGLTLDPGWVSIGYLQYVQINFGSQPIPPDVFSPRLASRALYATDQQMFIDFMDPREAAENGIEVPFYARNGVLRDDRLSTEAHFYHHPRPNGSLYSCKPETRVSRCASIVAEVSADLIVEKDIGVLIADLPPLVEIPIVTGDNREPYQIAIAHLADNNVDSDDVDEAPLLDGVEKADMSAKVVGEYVLLTLPSDEGFGPTLVIRLSQSGTRRVIVHLVAQHDMATLNAGVATSAFWRIYEWLKDEGLLSDELLDKAIKTDQRGRGRGGLDADPFDLKPADAAIELKYTTLVGAAKSRLTRSGRFLSGFTWSAVLRYNDDSQIMQCSAIRKPVAVTGFDGGPTGAAYLAARRSPLREKYRIDVSNFTKAAMARENFAAGTKLTYI
ncbi:hypothetical protein [Sphaerisporangium aureirubrum]|uniref:Uncharacterized protein n=1 Tax=Sphaerisporangium aureirubrum TaxID=1544736 RepID=A0ABW1ND02_9ACTN